MTLNEVTKHGLADQHDFSSDPSHLEVIDLDRNELLNVALPNNWRLSCQKLHISNIRTSVPGGVFTDLYKHDSCFRSGFSRIVKNKNQTTNLKGKILDGDFIYMDYNFIDSRWIGLEDWTYHTSLKIKPAKKNLKRTILIFEGLDATGQIVIWNTKNGTIASKMFNNMFTVVALDLGIINGCGILNIQVLFNSPIIYAQNEYQKQIETHGYPVLPNCVPELYQGECHVNHIRKMQASFGWDWGPAVASMGIYKPVFLAQLWKLLLRNIKFHTKYVDHSTDSDSEENDGQRWYLDIEFVFMVNKDTIEKCLPTLEFEIPEISFVAFELDPELVVDNSRIYDGELVRATAFIHTNIHDNKIEKWWPNGVNGVPKLYSTISTFKCASAYDGSLLDQMQVKKSIGFRSVELVQNPLIESGRRFANKEVGMTFHFKINGHFIYAKGSNWIPSHILPEHMTKKRITRLLIAAKQAHINILRVWGGGIYESDHFYELADKLGIMIWQDFMFACSLYQANTENLENVKDEVIDQMDRIQHHASIIMWAGNNENEKAILDNWYGTSNFGGHQEKKYRNDYIKLYVDTIMKYVREGDPGRPFVISSPSNGKLTETEGGFSIVPVQPNSFSYGDVHIYEYTLDNWSSLSYPNGRKTAMPQFVSEYGFQSLPSKYLIDQFNSNRMEETSLFSTWMNSRMKHPMGYLQLLSQISDKLQQMNSIPVGEEELGYFSYLTQIYQMESLKLETQLYLSIVKRPFHIVEVDNSSTTHGDGETMKNIPVTRGVMYWQLNDIWPGLSWSSLNYDGSWKMSHYAVESMFRTVSITAIVIEETILLHFICHELRGCNGSEEYNLILSLKKFDENQNVWSTRIDLDSYDLRPMSSTLVFERRKKQLFSEISPSPEVVDRLASKTIYSEVFYFKAQLFRRGKESYKSTHSSVSEQYVFFEHPLKIVNSFAWFDKSFQKHLLQQATVEITGIEEITLNCTSPLLCVQIDLRVDYFAFWIWLEIEGVLGRFDRNGFHVDCCDQKVSVVFMMSAADVKSLLKADTPVLIGVIERRLRVTWYKHTQVS